MTIRTNTPTTAEQLYVRLTPQERGDIVGAQNEDRLNWLRETCFVVDGVPTMEEMNRLHTMLLMEYTTKGNSTGGF